MPAHALALLPAAAARPIIGPLQARRIAMIVLRPSFDAVPCVTMWLRPNRALSRAGLRRLILGLTALALTTAAVGAWQGNVFAPLFAVLESGAVALALGLAWRAGSRGERISFDPNRLEVRALPGRQRISFQPCWVRVVLEPQRGGHRLLLASHGNTLEIGAFLAEQERLELARKLKALLAESSQPRR
jgi:uncharacterized membrane protein